MDQLNKEVENLNINSSKQVQIVEKIAAKDKEVVVHVNEYNNVKVKDYYVENAEEEVENKKFFSSEEFHENMRRGLSVIEDLNQNTSEVLRKGHKKFDDLNKDKIKKWMSRLIDVKSLREEIQKNLKGKEDKEKGQELEENKNDNIENFNIKSIYKKTPIGFEHFSSLFIYRAFKDDGTNAQISYSNNAKQWVICTKNESFLVKDKEELNHLPKQQNFIRGMCQFWFEYLATLDAKLTEELKSFLSGKTLLGELCGGVAKQYVRYSEPQLIFFSIVDNYSEDICFSPPEVDKIFKKFNLKCKTPVKTAECTTYQEFYKLFKAVNVEVNNYSFIEKGEGEVLYICGRPKLNPEQIVVLKMAKAKTIEYKILKEGEKYVKRLCYINNETSQRIIKTFLEVLPSIKTYAKSKIHPHSLASAIRLMKDDGFKNEQINDNSIQNYIKQQFGEAKLKSLLN